MTRKLFRSGRASLILHFADEKLTRIAFEKPLPDDLTARELRRLTGELARHPLAPDRATPFQQKVWKALINIPAGKTRTYGEIARRVGHPGAARAVGASCGANPLLLAIPCHRAVAANGLGGFALGLDLKRRLLELERTAA